MSRGWILPIIFVCHIHGLKIQQSWCLCTSVYMCVCVVVGVKRGGGNWIKLCELRVN